MPAEWTFQDAETRFGDIANAAPSGHPQYIRDGDASGHVVMSLDKSEQLRKGTGDQKTFAEFLLSAPRVDWDLAPADLKLRDVDL